MFIPIHSFQVKNWCDESLELLESQNFDFHSTSIDLIKKHAEQIRTIQYSAKEYKTNLDKSPNVSAYPELEATIHQVIQKGERIQVFINLSFFKVLEKIDEILVICNKKLNQLNKLAAKSKSPLQNISEQNVPKQPQIGAPVPAPNRSLLKKAYTIPKVSRFYFFILSIVHSPNGKSPDKHHDVKAALILMKKVHSFFLPISMGFSSPNLQNEDDLDINVFFCFLVLNFLLIFNSTCESGKI